jgi:hypothetical protein
MGKQTFDKIKKALVILLMVFLVASVTIGAASAKAPTHHKNNGNSGTPKHHKNNGKNGIDKNNKDNSGNDNSNADPGKLWNIAWNTGYNNGQTDGVQDAQDGTDAKFQDDGNTEVDEESNAVNDFNSGNIDQDQLTAIANNDGYEDGYLDGYNSV